MMFCVLPLIPIAYMAIGALLGGGAAVAAAHDWKSKPPYDKPHKAYENYVKSIEEGDYERYQWAVSEPIEKGEFEARCTQRKGKRLAKITEGAGDVSLRNDGTEGSGKATSPWSRKNIDVNYKKIGNTWKVVDKFE